MATVTKSRIRPESTQRFTQRIDRLFAACETVARETATRAAVQYQGEARLWMGRVSGKGGTGPSGETWPALTPKWLKQKAKLGYPLKMWLATGETQQAVGIHTNTKGNRVFAGIVRAEHPDAFEKAEAAEEFGVDYSTARPLFRPLRWRFEREIWPKMLATVWKRARRLAGWR